MSRCFPFPPPGYVKKARTDDVDLVKKEKEREKKHKKERRDKEKREGKERKEKDRTEGKHRDKKEKKDRHRDKRKDREKDKEKEKGQDREKDRGGTSEERRISEQADGRNSKERIVNKDRPPERIPGTSGQMDKEKNGTHVLDARRVDGLSARGGSAPKKLEKNQNFQNNHNNHAVHNSADAKFVLELGKRVRDEVGVTTHSGERITVIDQKDNGMVRLINALPGSSPNKKEKSQERKGGDYRSSGQGVQDERKTVTLRNSCSVPIPIYEGMPRPPKTSIEEKMAGREKIRDKEGEHMEVVDKHILLDPQKCKTPVKDKDRDRERRKDERTEKVENKVYEEEKLRERMKDSIDAATANDIVFHVLEEVNKIDEPAGNNKKRKHLEQNGFLRENETRQIKLLRTSSLSHPSLAENGRFVDAPQNANQCLLDKQRKPDVVKADKRKEHKPNGILKKKPEFLLSSLDAASLELLVEKQMTRSPHPDLKYLDEILTVPKFEELVPSEDDQEWLYGSHHAMQKQRKMGSSIEIKEASQQVWSEAMSLESADIVALPYVVPF